MSAALRIMFVDDEPAVLSSLSRLFLDEPYQIVSAQNATEALEKLHEFSPVALVVSDYRMPATNGVTLLQEIMRISPDTRRVILSAYSDNDILLDAVNRGRIHRYIVKPWDNELLKTIANELVGEYELLVRFRIEAEQLAQRNRLLSRSNEQLGDMLSEILDSIRSDTSLQLKPEKISPLNDHLHKHKQLSSRENEILVAVAAGKPLKAIAQELNISLKTVSTYKKRLSEKMNFRHDADLIRYALSQSSLSE